MFVIDQEVLVRGIALKAASLLAARQALKNSS